MDYYGSIKRMEERTKIYKEMKRKIIEKYNVGEFEQAAAYSQISAQYASECHMGFFVDQDLENVLINISNNTINTINKNTYSNKVLHVATVIYDVGGHTRLLKNWIDFDESRVNEVVLVDVEASNDAKEILSYFKRENIKVHLLNKKNFIEKAQELYDLSTDYEFIVLHTHPYDVVPIIAFAKNESNILFMNHADHRFWLGATISNTLLEIRNMGRTISKKQRFISDKHLYILPIPLKQPIEMERESIRKSLNINEDDIFIFSVASKHKYEPTTDTGIKNILLPLISQYQNLKVIIVGPSLGEDYWKEVFELSQGRIKAIGLKTEVDKYYLAADIYIDSYPVGSLTSLLDAAKYGVPIFSVNKSAGATDLDDVALDNIHFKYNSFSEIVSAISMYIEDENKRYLFGKECAEKVIQEHLNPYWQINLEKIFEHSAAIGKICISEANTNEISQEFDIPLVFMHFKNHTIEYELTSIFSYNYNLLTFKGKCKYWLLFLKCCIVYKSPLVRLLPIGIKRKVKKIIK